jgi:hypothetical protein
MGLEIMIDGYVGELLAHRKYLGVEYSRKKK